MADYEMPSGGDWSIHRGGAVFAEGVASLAVEACTFARVGGNAVFLSGAVRGARIAGNDFVLVGESAVATVGRLPTADGFNVARASGSTTECGAYGYPEDTAVVGNAIRGVGVHGKQTSALFIALSCRTNFIGNVAYNGPRAGVNVNDGFCGGHTFERNLIFNWVRETQDHGPINTWDRAMYLMPQQPGDGVDSDQPTLIPGWIHIAGNLIMNGPSGNRDLGNMFPAIDNDDGSAYYRMVRNVLVYGGAKNYLGHDKIWDGNLVAFPDRWVGDPCAQLWGGAHNNFVSNRCVVGQGLAAHTHNASDLPAPLGLDGTAKGFQCRIDLSNATLRNHTGFTASNAYWTVNASWSFGCGNATSNSTTFTLPMLQTQGWALGSTVGDVAGLTVGEVVGWAKEMLGV